MKHIKSFFFAGLTMLLLFSCATSSITTNKSDKLNGPYKKIFILINSSSRAKIFIDGFVNNVRQEFLIRNTEVEIYVKSELSLDTEKDINQKIDRYQAPAILIITQTESMIYGGIGIGSATGSNSGTFDLKLFDKSPDNLIWRATMKAYGDWGISLAVNTATKKFISKLEEDNIISKKI